MNPGWCRSRWISWRTAVYKVRLLDSDWRLYFPPYCGVLNTALTVVHSLTPFLPACLGSSKYSTRKGYPQIAAHWQVLVHDASCPTPPASGKSTLVITPSSRLCSPICNSGHYSNECQSHFKSFQPSQSERLWWQLWLRGTVACRAIQFVRRQIRGCPREISAPPGPQLCTHPGLFRHSRYT